MHYNTLLPVKHLITSFIYLCMLAALSLNMQTTIPPDTASTANTPTWKLVFNDEFSETTLDTARWNIENTAVGGYQNCCLNYGLQYFTPQALALANSSLRITTDGQRKGNYSYISGALTTENKFSFLYGRVDIRAKLPKTQSLWPALWLLPDHSINPAPFEIDMMELVGKAPDTVYMTNHWGKQQTAATFTGADFSQNYHTFSVVWNTQTITWFVDGVKRFQTSQGISNRPMYLIMNASVGGSWGGKPDASTVLPQSMDIDYVRIYQPLA